MQTVADWNRSEPLTSAALGLLLRDSRFGAPLLRKVAGNWVMWSKGDRAAASQAFDLGEGGLDATALLHFRRDQRARSRKGGRSEPRPERAAFREVDVVAWTGHVVLGIEVKVLSPRSPGKLSIQLAEQREELAAFAEAAGCSHIAQCVLAPVRVAGLQDGINQLTFDGLAAAVEALAAERETASDLLDAVSRQLARADAITKHIQRDYTTVGTEDLRKLVQDDYHVGVQNLVVGGEIDPVLARGRRWWRVTKHKPQDRSKWRSLREVIRALDGAAAGR